MSIGGFSQDENDESSKVKLYDLILKPGEALEACLRFKLAAEYYESCSLMSSCETSADISSRATFINDAGLAWKCLLDFEKAETLFLESISLRICGEKDKLLDPNTGGISVTFVNLLSSYCERASIALTDRQGPADAKMTGEMAQLYINLSLLLHLAGWTGPPGALTEADKKFN